MEGNFQKPDLVFYSIKSTPIVIAQKEDYKYTIEEREVLTLPVNGNKLGLDIATRTVKGLEYRVGSVTVFFDKKLSNINGSMTWDIPSLLINNEGQIISGQNVIRSINSGTGDFLGAEGYFLLETFELYVKYSFYFTNRP
jgi:hypothetical protein